jgi:hypothetical protein
MQDLGSREYPSLAVVRNLASLEGVEEQLEKSTYLRIEPLGAPPGLASSAWGKLIGLRLMKTLLKLSCSTRA